jgi:competence protein ComEA
MTSIPSTVRAASTVRASSTVGRRPDAPEGDRAGSLCTMEDDPIDQRPTARVARWFQPSPAELTGLAVLLLGAVVVSGVLWFQAAQRPSDLGSGAAAAGVGVAADGSTDGPAPGVTDGLPPPGTGGEDSEHGGYDGDHGVGADPAAGGGASGPDPDVDVEVTVHVTGAVGRPGLIVLPDGGRVGDAVEAAGGLATDAQAERINLARPLVDGEHVHVLREGEDPPPPTSEAAPGGDLPGAAAPDGVMADGRIDINRAGPVELETLPGIGPARAEAIVAHRDQHGPFTVPGDLRAVSGIGEVIFQRLAELITVG